MTAVRLEGVKKSYGSQPALSGLSFALPRGAICGLVGPNGAGKTTTMGLLAGLLRHDSGHVDILGAGIFRSRTHSGRVSLMPQDCSPSAHTSLREILRFYAELQGVHGGAADDEVARRLAEVQLQDRAHSKYGQLSHGMRRRFSIAQALLGTPELILLDEPTSGLDPELVVHVRELLRAQGGRATLLVSSHILAELEALCDYVVFIDGGKCLRQGSLGDVTRAENVVRYTLTSAPDLDALRQRLPGCVLRWAASPAGLSGLQGSSGAQASFGELSVHAPPDQPVADTNRECLRALLDADVGVLEVQAGDSLEQSYLRAKQLK
jgi:ABC-2 type transport system ATP-binding protein